MQKGLDGIAQPVQIIASAIIQASWAGAEQTLFSQLDGGI